MELTNMFEKEEEMQTRIAYLERAGQELSDVVYRQQLEIDGLRQALKALIDRLASADVTPRAPIDERPPHY
jgi:uncharacterized coiled-coil protein SlyX